MSSVAQAGRQQPIFIAEILTLIFSYLDRRSVARTAQVCKQWSDVALDTLWHLVTDVQPLLALLAPLMPFESRSTFHGSISTLKFRRPLRPKDWTRFDRYSHRVRSIDLDDRRANVRRKLLDKSIFEEMEATCPRPFLLPNIQSLRWCMADTTGQIGSLITMHGGLQHASIQLNNSRAPTLATYVNSIVERAPRIIHLEVRSPHPVREIEHEFRTLVRGLTQLKHLTLPLYFLSNEVTATVASLACVETISFAEPIEGAVGDRADVNHFAPEFAEDALGGLKKLSLSAHLQHALAFMGASHAPSNISSLRVNILAIDDPPVLQDLLSTMNRFELLTELILDFIVKPGAPVIFPPPSMIARPSIETLRPILSCQRLRKFVIRWDYRLNLIDADMEEIASSWPALEYLHLHSEPITEPDGPALTLRALIPFARHCLSLQHLALYLDGDSIPSRSVLDYPQPFQCLRALSLGSSPVTVKEPTVLYLSQLCPVDCVVSAGIRWPDAYGIVVDNLGFLQENSQKWWILWREIGNILPLVVRARQDEKARVMALHQRMESLTLARV